MWDKWAYLRIGQRTYMASTYDRRGANETADASSFLYQLADDRNVSLDVTGPGVLAFVRTNHWHGSPWHYIVDGTDHVVQESSTATPDKPVPNSVFMPEKNFPNPLTWTWSQTKGADLSWVPIPFERSFTMAYERTHYGTGYYIYHKYVTDAKLSAPIRSWSPDDVPPADVLYIIRRCNTQWMADSRFAMESDRVEVGPKLTQRLLVLNNGPSEILEIGLRIPSENAALLERARLKIYWDGASTASVDAPVPLLFGTGTFYNRDNQRFLVKAFPVHVRFAQGKLHLGMFFPMPFMKEARIELQNDGEEVLRAEWNVRHRPYRDPPNWVGHFHATYVDHGVPEPGKDLVFLDTTKVEGGGDWCGHFVGTSFIFSDKAFLGTLEGDPRFYFDDSQTPQAQGTGTEEWGGGGDYWGGRTMTLPFAGHPVGAKSPKEAKGEQDLINSAYRFLLSDLMPFGKNARITFEHGPESNSPEHYQSVTYWYGLHQPFLILTDTFDVGDAADEEKHHYVSPTASPVQTLSSRYEWGVDHLKEQEIYPESADTGRNMTGTSTFTISLRPDNLGVLLRRKMDYSFPNQCAVVSLADDRPDAAWKEVGTWYTAGSNTIVYSNPKEELGATQHNVRTSNRRWRDDEFLLPRSLTQGRSSVRVRIRFTPRSIPLFPGRPLADQAWSEYRYNAYCFVMPKR